jgi:hypothetical protein
LREQVEAEWAAMKEQHAAEVEPWTEECTKLLQAGTRKKDLPPKPKLGKKPQIPVIDDEDDDVEEEPGDDEDV